MWKYEETRYFVSFIWSKFCSHFKIIFCNLILYMCSHFIFVNDHMSIWFLKYWLTWHFLIQDFYLVFKIRIWKATHVKSLFTQNYISQNIKNVAIATCLDVKILPSVRFGYNDGYMYHFFFIFFYTCWFWLLQYNSAGFCNEVIVYLVYELFIQRWKNK